jgi:hypothetical protein
MLWDEDDDVQEHRDRDLYSPCGLSVQLAAALPVTKQTTKAGRFMYDVPVRLLFVAVGDLPWMLVSSEIF